MASKGREASPKAQGGGRGGTLLWHHLWTAVFAANLVLPMWVASDMLGQGGEVGMALAVGILWLAGDLAGVRSRDLRRILIGGGIAVAVSQFFPILQFWAGMFSVVLVGWAFEGPRNELGLGQKLSGVEGFLATFLTGSLLLLACYLAGAVFLWFSRLGTVPSKIDPAAEFNPDTSGGAGARGGG